MLKDNIRVRLLRLEEVDPAKVYLMVGTPKGMGPAQLEVYNDDDQLWYSVAIYAEEVPRIING